MVKVADMSMRLSTLPRFASGRAWAWIRDLRAAVDTCVSLHPRLPDAIRLPGLRWLARARARALFDLCAGFVYSQVLVACVQANLFALLRERPRSLAEIAAVLRLEAHAADRLLGAATALRLLSQRRDGRYALGPLGAAVAADAGIAAMVTHHHLLYADLADPLAFLRGSAPAARLSEFWPYGKVAERGDSKPYTVLMAASQAMVARQVLATVPFAHHRKLLDLGGGNGAFLRAVAARHPHLALALVDLPTVAEQARQDCAGAGLAVEIFGGDLRDAAVPPDVDVVSLVRVLHDHDDATVRQILANVARQLAPGRTLVIAEPMADVAGAERVGNVYFPFYLAAMGTGRTRSPAVYASLLVEAGFTRPTCPPTPLPVVASVLIAQVAPPSDALAPSQMSN